MLNYKELPESLREGIRLYFEDGIKPGSFLMAVLQNDLIQSFACADEGNRARMFEIVRWVYNESPRGASGSPEACRKHMLAKKREREAAHV